MRQADVVETGRTPAEVRLRLGVVCGALAVVVYALTQAVVLPLRPTLLLACSFGPVAGDRQRRAVGAAWAASPHRHPRHRPGRQHRGGGRGHADAAGPARSEGLVRCRPWRQRPARVAGGRRGGLPGRNGIQLGLDVAWDLFLAIGTAMLAWNMRQHPRFGGAYAATGLLLAAALIGLNLAAFPDNPGRASLIDVGPLVGLWYLWVTLRMAWSLRWAQQHRRESSKD